TTVTAEPSSTPAAVPGTPGVAPPLSPAGVPSTLTPPVGKSWLIPFPRPLPRGYLAAGVGIVLVFSLIVILAASGSFASPTSVDPQNSTPDGGKVVEQPPIKDEVPEEARFPGQPKELVRVLGTSRGRHWEEITAVAFPRNGEILISSALDGVISV